MKKTAYVLIGLGFITLFSDVYTGFIVTVNGVLLYLYAKKKHIKSIKNGITGNNIDFSTKKSDSSPTETTRIRFSVMGLKYEGRNEILHSYVSSRVDTNQNGHRVLNEDDIIELKDEDNPYDPNAIAIHHPLMGKIGYVPKDTTSRVRNFYQSNKTNTLSIRYSEQEDGEYIATVRIKTPAKGNSNTQS